MHELDRIEQALASKRLDHNQFERCAQDLLIETYPGLSSIPGGTDWGRDADIHDDDLGEEAEAGEGRARGGSARAASSSHVQSLAAGSPHGQRNRPLQLPQESDIRTK